MSNTNNKKNSGINNSLLNINKPDNKPNNSITNSLLNSNKPNNSITNSLLNSNKKDNKPNNSITNILLNSNKPDNKTNNSMNNTVEKCKKIMMNKQLIAMLSIKDIVAGSIGTVIPWLVLLIIVGFIIVV